MAEDIAIRERREVGIATVMARKGVPPSSIGALLAANMPNGPEAVPGGGYRILGLGPGSWLVMQDRAESSFAQSLKEKLAGHASVSDQSSGYAVLRLSGPGARIVLQRGAAIDFHPDSFRPGSAAVTVIAHIGVILWQVDDEPTYDLAVFRSLAGSFRHWLDQAVATL